MKKKESIHPKYVRPKTSHLSTNHGTGLNNGVFFPLLPSINQLEDVKFLVLYFSYQMLVTLSHMFVKVGCVIILKRLYVLFSLISNMLFPSPHAGMDVPVSSSTDSMSLRHSIYIRTVSS